MSAPAPVPHPTSDVVLVTGSSGFIGRALVGKLAGRHAVVGLDRGEPPRLPAGASFDPKVHGHWSAQRGAAPLVTLFVKHSAGA